MQVKKDEVKAAIMNAAEQEFFVHGYQNASLRKIVKMAGTTLGNFYNYFENKEKLFEALVAEEYQQFVYFLQHHDQMHHFNQSMENFANPLELRPLLMEMLNGVEVLFSNRLVLLLESSKGTRFEKAKVDLLELLKEHFCEHFSGNTHEHYPEKLPEQSLIHQGTKEQFAEILAEQFLTGIVLVIRKNEDYETKKKLIVDYMLFYIMGVWGLFHNAANKR
ncbi:hypothetical protein BHU72_05655 [Desulfuribacillus stibiiarsenatis]|uniref:HTH tetR-type domain-containing protein n=1 Tax=Desulfuribacillus stibiiarsenatis TaxID=1390249 RepID=A0A1E5L4P1_9FIRM|nr:TetR/AcrR family transcriptional regulator [Desulfuribacillus stibiiarsenatis]OEH85095.1 hypothetical protein BHU72_05655 [Desulfuribacillus stibiiarsenatis]